MTRGNFLTLIYYTLATVGFVGIGPSKLHYGLTSVAKKTILLRLHKGAYFTMAVCVREDLFLFKIS